MREPVPLAVLLMGVLMTTGCTGSGAGDPPPSRFAAGTCRQAAAPTIAVGKLLDDVAHHHKTPKEIEPAISREQSRLRALLATAGPATQPVQDLITAIGFFRISLDSGTYGASRLTDVTSAREGLIRYCTK